MFDALEKMFKNDKETDVSDVMYVCVRIYMAQMYTPPTRIMLLVFTACVLPVYRMI